MSFLEPRVSFSWNFASLFCDMRYNSYALFHQKLRMVWTKRAYQRANLQTFDCLYENSLCHFTSYKSIFLQILHYHSVSWLIISLKFTSWNISLDKKAHQSTMFRRLSALMKVHPIPHAIFETNRPGRVFKFCILLVHVIKDNFSTFFNPNDKKSLLKWNFQILEWLGEFTKFLMSYLKPKVNFASLFSVMRDNSSVLF